MKIFIKKIILPALLLLPQVIHSQDLIILRNGKEIPCKITRIDSVNLFYDFIRGERTLSSYINKDEVRSYTRTSETLNAPGTGPESSRPQKVNIDTTKFVRPSYSWNNLLTYSRRFGAYANGWAVSYYGFVNYDQSKWIIPCKFSMENFIIHSFPKDVYVYHSYEIYYGELGITPIRRLKENLYFNLGVQFLFGSESSGSALSESNNIFGLDLSQGIFLIPNSRFGMTIGLGVYEKILNSYAYKRDIGVNIQVGLKF